MELHMHSHHFTRRLPDWRAAVIGRQTCRSAAGRRRSITVQCEGVAAAGNDMQNQASIQDDFLQSLMTEETLASVYLVNGIRLSGRVQSFDRYVVILDSASGRQMVFKHAISTVVPVVLNAARCTSIFSQRRLMTHRFT